MRPLDSASIILAAPLISVFDTGIMKDIQDSWAKNSIEEGKLGVCAMKCGSEFDPFAAQFK